MVRQLLGKAVHSELTGCDRPVVKSHLSCSISEATAGLWRAGLSDSVQPPVASPVTPSMQQWARPEEVPLMATLPQPDAQGLMNALPVSPPPCSFLQLLGLPSV